MADHSRRATLASRPRAGRGLDGERRIVTVLFCDVVDSTTLAEGLDPEDWAEIMHAAFPLLTAPIQRYAGKVARLMGDAVLAFFGAPVAHEDDPRRAALAALEIIEGIEPFRDEIRRDFGLDFNVRVGINTGPVVVGEVGAELFNEYTAMGDAVNVAARMEQTAEAGMIQISGDTCHLIAPFFDAEPRGAIQVKGRTEPVPAFRLVGPKAQPESDRGLEGMQSPLVGREDELARLRAVLEQTAQGRGQIVCITGEAGLGKSRLLEELRNVWTGEMGQTFWAESHGVAYDADRPYSLFRQRVREFFGIELDDTVETIQEKVSSGMRQKGGTEKQATLCSIAASRIVASRSLEAGEDVSAQAVSQEIREQMFLAWREIIGQQPAVMVFDDLHWSDSASAALIMELMPLVEEGPALFIFAFRPERKSPAWQIRVKADGDFPHRLTEIELAPLDHDALERLTARLLGDAELPADLRDLIVHKADGNPYFVEEIVRSLLDQGLVERTSDGLRLTGARIEDIAIPDSLQGLLMARIDRLDPDCRATLQLAAVIGRLFYYRVLEAISDSTMALEKQLSSLERVDLVKEESRVPDLLYHFRQEMARETAYRSILNRKRRELHRRVGEAIETIFADRLEEHAHRLGQHFAAAHEHERALKYYTMAGEAAAGLDARTEAAAQFGHALEAARRLGRTSDDIAALAAQHTRLLGSSTTDALAAD